MNNIEVVYDIWLEDFTEYSSFSDICKVHGDVKFLGANIYMGIVF